MSLAEQGRGKGRREEKNISAASSWLLAFASLWIESGAFSSLHCFRRRATVNNRLDMRPLWPNLAGAQGLPGSFRDPTVKGGAQSGPLGEASVVASEANDSRHRAAADDQLYSKALSVPVGLPPLSDSHVAGHQQMNDKKDNPPHTQRSCRRPTGLFVYLKQKKNPLSTARSLRRQGNRVWLCNRETSNPSHGNHNPPTHRPRR